MTKISDPIGSRGRSRGNFPDPIPSDYWRYDHYDYYESPKRHNNYMTPHDTNLYYQDYPVIPTNNRFTPLRDIRDEPSGYSRPNPDYGYSGLGGPLQPGFSSGRTRPQKAFRHKRIEKRSRWGFEAADVK